MPFASGTVAAMLPAAGTGGGVVSRLVKCATAPFASGRPAASLIAVETVAVYAVFAVRSAAGRSAAVGLPADSVIAPPTAAPPSAASIRAAGVTVAGSTGAENVTTIAVESGAEFVPSAGVIAVTVRMFAASDRFTVAIAPIVSTAAGADAVSYFARSYAVIVV